MILLVKNINEFFQLRRETRLLTNVLESGLLFSSKTGGVQVFSDKSTYWLAGNGPRGVGGLELVYLSAVGLQFAKLFSQ
jgi:hypothetical protein